MRFSDARMAELDEISKNISSAPSAGLHKDKANEGAA
jgi:hypothetical protein